MTWLMYMDRYLFRYMSPTHWCCWCADAADALMLLMRWCCWCADAADVLMLLMHWCYWTRIRTCSRTFLKQFAVVILQWKRPFVQTLVQFSSCWNEWNYHLQNSLLPAQSRLSIQASLKAIQHPWEGKGGFSFHHQQQQHTNHSLQHILFASSFL